MTYNGIYIDLKYKRSYCVRIRFL